MNCAMYVSHKSRVRLHERFFLRAVNNETGQNHPIAGTRKQCTCVKFYAATQLLFIPLCNVSES